MIVYFALSIRYYNVYKKVLVQVLSNAHDFAFVWVRNFLLAFLGMLVAWVILVLFDVFSQMNYVKVWWYFLSYALICYYIAIEGYANAVSARVFFKTDIWQTQKTVLLLAPQSVPLLPEASPTPEAVELPTDPAPLSDTDMVWKDKLTQVILQERLYENPELSLPDLSKKLQINIPLLSRIINKGFGLNFNDFINQYRIEAVIAALLSGKHHKQTLLAIAYDCGFNSKTTFNRAFKKHTSLSPKDYIKKNC